MQVKEIRSPELDIKMCVMKRTKEHDTVFEVKQGKKIEYIPLKCFIDLVNEFIMEDGEKLYISQTNLDELVCYQE